MAITKSAKKAFRQSLKRKALNDWRRSLIKRAIRNFKKAIQSKNKEEAEKWLVQIYKQVDKAAKRFLHKNRASRIKSRYSKIFAQHFSEQKS